jgi:hypothetical protein
MSHTQGKLKAQESRIYFADLAGGFDIRNCPSPEANARRLVACWNACEGISTDALETEGGAVMGWVRTASKLIAATTQRDELLEALKELTLAYQRTAQYRCLDEVKEDEQRFMNAKAAIAKVEGTL